MTKAFDTALFVPQTDPDTGQAVGVGAVGPPFDSDWYYYAIAPGPGVTIGANVPAATAPEQILVAGPGPMFAWMAQLPYYLGALNSFPPTNLTRDAPTPVAPGTMFFYTPESTPYLWDGANWNPLPLATGPQLSISASLPAPTGQGQMLLAGPPGRPGGPFLWQASIGMFLGAAPLPPTQAPGGAPIPIGGIYYNTSNGQVYVWNGSSWQSVPSPSKAAVASLYYESIAGQTAFPTTASDLFGRTHTFVPATNEGVEVYLNGVRLMPNGGSVAGDYSLNATTSTITMSSVVPVSSIVAIDVLEDPANLAPADVLINKLKPFVFDGVTTTFLMLLSSGAGIVAGATTNLHVMLDGVEQEPGVDFTLSADGKSIIYAAAPNADVHGWILYDAN
jgi:hypothetical protein